MRKLLTNKKSLWAKRFNPKVLKGSPLNPNISDALRYKKKLDRLIDLMTNEVEKQIRKLFNTDHAEEFFGQDDEIGSQARILTNKLTAKFDGLFASIAKPLAEQVVSDAEKSSSASLHTSLKELSGGLSLKTSAISDETKNIFNASITENVALITSIPQKYLNEVQQATMRSITSGNGLQDLIPFLENSKGITKRRAKMIAYDQTRKAFNAVNKSRMQNLGIEEFQWLHTGGSNEPRQDHIAMSGKIYKFSDPPPIGRMHGAEVRGFPGQLPNCRCRMIPVIKFEQ